MTKPADEGSANAGSLEELIDEVPSANEGETKSGSDANSSKEAPEGFVPKDQYENLEKKLGEQGEELGKMRSYIEDLEPFMEKIQNNEALVDAIFADKITPDMAKAILDGKVSMGEATKIADANEKVKQELGASEYSKLSPEDLEARISQKVEERVSQKLKELDAKFDSHEEERKFTQRIEKFIANTPDYSEYAEDVNKFFEEHPHESDIEIAYKAVKADHLQKKLDEKNGKDAAEYAKELALNNAAGDNRGGSVPTEGTAFEDFVANIKNSNA